METALIQRVVKVTPEHIERGVACNPTACPLALALQDVYGYAFVGSKAGYVGAADRDSRYRLDVSLQKWVADFDLHEYSQPIEVAVDADNRRLWIVPEAPAGAHWDAEGRLEWEDTQADPRDQLEPHSALDLADDGVGL